MLGSSGTTTEYSHVLSFKNVTPGSRVVQFTTKASGFGTQPSAQDIATSSSSGTQTDISIVEPDSGPGAPKSAMPSPSASTQPATLSDKFKKSHHQVRRSDGMNKSSLWISSTMVNKLSSEILS